jgi:hypothetical protein
MILPPVLLLGAHLIMPVADSVPTLNVEQVCKGIAQQGGVSFHDTDIAEEKQNCLDSEQAIRDELEKEWSSFMPADKVACTNESKMGGDSSYTELLTCLEMARDVRNLQSEADIPAAKPAPPAAAVHTAPAAATPIAPVPAPPAPPPVAASPAPPLPVAPAPTQPSQQ